MNDFRKVGWDTSRYILDEHGEPQQCPDLMEWAVWMETHDRRIAQDLDENDEKGLKIRVSTVFLALDHRFGHNGPPVLFETMVFGGVLDRKQDRYCTLAEALAGHQEMCRRVSETLHHGD